MLTLFNCQFCLCDQCSSVMMSLWTSAMSTTHEVFLVTFLLPRLFVFQCCNLTCSFLPSNHGTGVKTGDRSASLVDAHHGTGVKTGDRSASLVDAHQCLRSVELCVCGCLHYSVHSVQLTNCTVWRSTCMWQNLTSCIYRIISYCRRLTFLSAVTEVYLHQWWQKHRIGQ